MHVLRTAARLVGIAALALTGTGLLAGKPTMAHPAARAQASQATVAYSSAAYSYSFQYPTNWKVEHAKGVDMAVLAPGQHAGFLAIVKAGTESAAALKADLKTLLAGVGPFKGAPQYSVQAINGVHYGGWQADYANGKQASTGVAFGTAHGKYTYFFLMGVDKGLPSTKANEQGLLTILSSLKLR